MPDKEALAAALEKLLPELLQEIGRVFGPATEVAE